MTTCDLASENDASLEAATRPAWIETRPGHPYFFTEHGETWTPIGQNDAITWPELSGLFQRRDLETAERYLRDLKAHGVTCLRLMLEYVQTEHRYIENPVGRFAPNMVRLWDDLFALCERIGLHILLTPVDTFFMWIRWDRHPYNARNGGPAKSQREWLTNPGIRDAVKARLAFASDRWGGSPALFAWDLWNEIHPAHGDGDLSTFAPFIEDVGTYLRAFEIERHGRAHLQTVSIFGPELVLAPELNEPIFRHPTLDFANTHLYEKGTIDDPQDTIAPALAVGRLIRKAVREARDGRPVFDSEHGPIHRFKDKHVTLPDAFDDEYFRHMQWAHLASGGAGGGMRWPNRHPHSLTPGMRVAQRGLSEFLPLIDWTRFRRENLNEEIVGSEELAWFGCGDEEQALIWGVRTDAIGPEGTLAPTTAVSAWIEVPGLRSGQATATFFDTATARIVGEKTVEVTAGTPLHLGFEVRADVAIAIRRRA